MTAKELPSMWLREQAKTMRQNARNHRNAAYTGELRDGCDYVAAAYERAGVLFDDAATKWEDDHA